MNRKIITEFSEYQRATNETAVYPKDKGIEYCIIGLIGEAGELANKYAKVIRDDGGVVSAEKGKELFVELGDILWFASELATNLNAELSDVADYNIVKLLDRKSRNKLSGSGDHR